MKCECGKPTSGGAWCSSCRHTTDVAIANVATYHDDLDTVRTRQTSYGGPASLGSVGKSQPLVVDASFLPDGRGTRAQAATRNAVTTWARALHDDRPELGWPKYDTVHSVCSHFAKHLGTISGLPWADEFKADMLSLERELAKVVDRPADAWYAGLCGFVVGDAHDGSICACGCHNLEHEGACETAQHGGECDVPGGCGREFDASACEQPLYANATQVYITCRTCGTTYHVDERRDELLEQARDREATVEVITRIVTTLGDQAVRTEKVAARIRQWSVRGRITSHGQRVVNGRPRPVYRIGDVLDLLNREDTGTA